MAADPKNITSNIHRALIFQGGGSLGAYEAGAYKAIKEDLSEYFRIRGEGKRANISYRSRNVHRRDKRCLYW